MSSHASSPTRPGQDLLLLIARLLLTALFIISGWSKITSFAATIAYMAGDGVPLPQVAAVIAIIAEFVFGIAILVGIGVTPLSLFMAVYTIITGLIGHHFWTYAPGAVHYDMMLHFYKNLGIAGGFLALSITGAGRYAIGGKKSF